MGRSIVGKAEDWTHAVSRAVSLIGVIILLLMTLLVALDVFGRYALRRPISGSLDMIEVMMVVLVYSGLAYCASTDGNVRVDVLYIRFSKRIQAYLDVFASLCSVTIVGLIAWQLGARAWKILQDPPGPATGYFQWPFVPFIAFAALGSALLCLELLVWFFHSLVRARGGEIPTLAVATEEHYASG